MAKSSSNPRHRKPTLLRELTWTLVLKFALIYLIWLWFFSSPVDESLNDTQVQHAIFGPQSATAARTESNRNSPEDP